MAALPYVTAPGNIDRTLNGIKSAAVPERVSQDFVKTILKIPGGSGAQMTTFLKKLGMANNDGTPSDLYKKFRNPTSSGAAIAAAIRGAYAPLYTRNEFTHELSDAQLLGLVVEETGQPHDSTSVRSIVSCIKHLKGFATFSASPLAETPATPSKEDTPPPPPPALRDGSNGHRTQTLGLNLGYTINLNLPATADPEVFDAIFKSLKEHLLRADDA